MKIEKKMAGTAVFAAVLGLASLASAAECGLKPAPPARFTFPAQGGHEFKISTCSNGIRGQVEAEFIQTKKLFAQLLISGGFSRARTRADGFDTFGNRICTVTAFVGEGRRGLSCNFNVVSYSMVNVF